MKCPKCGIENKPEARICKKCGTQLIIKPVWLPTWKWHLKTLAIIFTILVILFFTFNALFKQYMRKIPTEITPWLKK